MATYLDLQDEVISHQLNDTKYRPYVKEWLNEAERFIALQAGIRTGQDVESYSTTSDDATLALPSDFLRIIDLANTDDDDLLRVIDLRSFDDLPSQTGQPTYYVIIGQNVTLYPTPDAVYPLQLRYWSLPPAMTSDGVSPTIPAQYHHLLVRYALMRAFQRENDYEAAAYYREQFENDVQKLRGEVQYEGQDGPRQVPGMWDDGVQPLGVWR
jgi:hypothetical protein